MGKDSPQSNLDNRVDVNRSDVPYSVLCGGFHIEIFGNTKFEFEGKYTILEYTENLLKVRANKRTFNILGSKLALNNVENSSFMVTGIITNIEFE